MKVELALPPSKRDLRLDLFRGLANWLMFLGHVSTSALAWFSFRNYGFSDGADLFVFISGYTSALVFGRRMLEGGFVVGTTRLLRRVWQIYAAHILLFVIYLASVHFLSKSFDAPVLIDRFNVAPLLNAPVETITQGLLLRYKPLNLDVLPLYVILMGAFPPLLWMMLRHPNWGMLGSVLLYFAARQFSWNLPSYPSGVWYFNPFAWQLLFVLGAWLALGGANTLHFLVRSRAVLVLGLAYLLFATVMIDVALKQAESGARSEAAVLEIAARVESLSPRERQVMEGLVGGLSNKRIAREYDISPRTIEVYRANVMTKMQASSLSELVRLAMRAGAIKD